MAVTSTLLKALVESATLDELKTFRKRLVVQRLSGVYQSMFQQQQIVFSSAEAMDAAIEMLQSAIEQADGRGAPRRIGRIIPGPRRSPWPYR